MKVLTPGEAETKRQQAIDFLNRIGQREQADRFEEMTPEEYAEHRGMRLLDNPRRRNARTMPRTKRQLETELEQANDYIEELESRLDETAGIAADEDEDDDAGDDDEE